MSLLSLCQAACDQIGVSRPTSVVAQSDATTRILFSCANREGRSLAKRCPWQALVKTHTFTAVNGQQQYMLPTDYNRMIPETAYNTRQRRECFGPLTAQEWAAATSLNADPFVDAFLVREGNIWLLDPQGGDTYRFDYVSANWVQDSSGSARFASWQRDSDESLLPEELIALGVIWRFKQARGLDYQEDRATYEFEVATRVAQETSGRIISMTGERDFGPASPVIQEGSWTL